jgi:hypothetical protein
MPTRAADHGLELRPDGPRYNRIRTAMNAFKRISLAASAVALALTASAIGAPANAASVKVGVLNCDVSRGWGFIIGSSKELRCTFSPAQGEIEHYVGTVSKFGVDIGYTRGGVIIWDVLAPTLSSKEGALQGGYAGATASASVGVGGGAHVLVGGFHRSIALQPISITGESGLNVAAGIGAISLKHVG